MQYTFDITGATGWDTLGADVPGGTFAGLHGFANALIAMGIGNDTLEAGDGSQIILDTWDGIVVGDGDDRFYGEGGDDTIYGETGDDGLFGGSELDVLYGGDGNDTIYVNDLPAPSITMAIASALAPVQTYELAYGGNGNDTIYGDIGRDSLSGGENDDMIYGGAGGDVVLGEAGNDTVDGGDGDDSVLGGDGDNRVSGGIGADFVSGGANRDTLLGGDGDDRIVGNDGDDILGGVAGVDTLYGGNGNDTYRIDSATDVVTEEGLTDTRDEIVTRVISIDLNDYSGIENVELEGNLDLDATGTNGAGNLSGNKGDNILTGNGGDDAIFGGRGADQMLGGDGADYMFGNGGSDTMTGGTGADVYIFFQEDNLGLRDRSDVITDFDQGEDHMEFGKFLGSFTLVETFSADGRGTEFSFNATSQRLLCDIDSNGTADFAIVLQGLTNVTLEDLGWIV